MNDYSFESGLDCDDIKEHRKEMLEEGLNINLNINMIEDGNNTALEIVDSADDLVVPDTQNNDADSQGTNQHPQP